MGSRDEGGGGDEEGAQAPGLRGFGIAKKRLVGLQPLPVGRVALLSSSCSPAAHHLLHTTYYAPRTWHHAPSSSVIPDEGATWPPRAGVLLVADEETTLKHRSWRKRYVGSLETRSHANIPNLTGCAGSSGMTKKRMGGRSRHGPGSRAQSALERGFACSSFRLFTDVTPIPNAMCDAERALPSPGQPQAISYRPHAAIPESPGEAAPTG